MKAQYYVGHKAGTVSRFVFKSEATPTRESHGHIYSAVTGPFRTKRGAQFDALFGHANPHIQCVNDAERIARSYAKQTA